MKGHTKYKSLRAIRRTSSVRAVEMSPDGPRLCPTRTVEGVFYGYYTRNFLAWRECNQCCA